VPLPGGEKSETTRELICWTSTSATAVRCTRVRLARAAVPLFYRTRIKHSACQSRSDSTANCEYEAQVIRPSWFARAERPDTGKFWRTCAGCRSVISSVRRCRTCRRSMLGREPGWHCMRSLLGSSPLPASARPQILPLCPNAANR